jgi:Flp pilus assembly protein TadD
MCPKPARLATALAAVLAMTAAAPPAFALFGKSKKAEAAAKRDAKPADALPAGVPAAGAPAAAAQPAAPQPRKATPEERAAVERMDPLARASFWAREVQADPKDVDASIHLSQALRAMGRADEAAQAAAVAVVLAPDNVEAILEDARAKIGGGQAFYAIEGLQRAKTLAPKDWRPVSLLGVALEASERPEEARAAYSAALALSPDNPAILSNLGLFLTAQGDTAGGEAMLRKAASRPGATAQERMNLALVLGLQGKLAEAERLMRRDLPPAIANANLAYFRDNRAGATATATARNWDALTGPPATR